jgi:hypothetical protein
VNDFLKTTYVFPHSFRITGMDSWKINLSLTFESIGQKNASQSEKLMRRKKVPPFSGVLTTPPDNSGKYSTLS